METVFYLLVWLCLIFAPPLSYVFFKALRRHRPKQRIPFVIGCATSLVIIGIIASIGIQFTAPIQKIACFVFLYLIYCFLAANCLQISQKFLRWITIAVFAIPIFLGYIISTIGFLGLAFIVEDETRAPKYIEEMKPNLICRISYWGTAFSDSGYSVDLYERWIFLPFLERHLEKISINETAGNAKGASCADVLVMYERSKH